MTPASAVSQATYEELAPGLYRLGQTVPVHGDVSWLHGQAVTQESLNCYLVVGVDAALLMDTAPAICRDNVITNLRELVGGRRLSIFISRNEPESTGNLAEILTEFPDSVLLYAGGGNLLEWFYQPATEAGDNPVTFDGLAELGKIPDGSVREVSPEISLHCHSAPLRQLTTYWCYEANTRSLFTSDSFGWTHPTGPDGSDGSDGAEPSVASVEQQLTAKFDWLAGAEGSPADAQLSAIIDSHPIDFILPSHGLPVRGPAAVAQRVALTRSAIHNLAAVHNVATANAADTPEENGSTHA